MKFVSVCVKACDSLIAIDRAKPEDYTTRRPPYAVKKKTGSLSHPRNPRERGGGGRKETGKNIPASGFAVLAEGARRTPPPLPFPLL